MGNYCSGTLTIKASVKCKEAIFNQLYGTNDYGEKSQFDFNKVIPMPEIEEKDFFDWRNENWGTSANCIVISTDSDTLYFITDYSACIPVISTLAAKYPDAQFFYAYENIEEGFCGFLGFFHGKVKYEIEAEIEEYKMDEEGNAMRFPDYQEGRNDKKETITSESEGIRKGTILSRVDKNGCVYLVEGKFTDSKNEYEPEYDCRQIPDMVPEKLFSELPRDAGDKKYWINKYIYFVYWDEDDYCFVYLKNPPDISRRMYQLTTILYEDVPEILPEKDLANTVKLLRKVAKELEEKSETELMTEFLNRLGCRRRAL